MLLITIKFTGHFVSARIEPTIVVKNSDAVGFMDTLLRWQALLDTRNSQIILLYIVCGMRASHFGQTLKETPNSTITRAHQPLAEVAAGGF